MDVMMTRKASVSVFLIALVCSQHGTVGLTASESDPARLPAPTQATKDSTTGAGELRKEVPEPDDQSNKFNVLKLERDLLQSKADDLQRQIETVQQDLASGKKMLGEANARAAALEKEKGQIAAALTESRDQARDLAPKLAAEQVKSATLREDKQRLMSGTTTAKEEIARLQKRAGELETEAARTEDLVKRLAERDQEIERLRKAAADRESLANKVGGLTDKLDRAKGRVATFTEELAALSEEATLARQARDQLSLEMRRQQEPNKEAAGATALGQVESILPGEHETSSEKLRREQVKMENTTTTPDERRAPEEAAKPSPNGEAKAAVKEMRGQRLASAQAVLIKALEPEIVRGDVDVLKGRDRLIITMTDRALFDTGQGQFKPDGVKLLKKVTEVLKPLPDKHVRLESRTDQSAALLPKDQTAAKDHVANPWELSMARVSHLLQHLIEDGAVSPSSLSLGMSPEGRTGLTHGAEDARPGPRRLEIILSLMN